MLFKNRKIQIDKRRLQEVVFLIGIFVFFAVLFIGLFPYQGTEIIIGKDLFIYTIMSVPALAAIYFIITSFRQSVYLKSYSFDSSIKNKIALAFVFVAIFPSLLIILASNNFINQTLSRLISNKSSKAFNEAITMSNEPVIYYYNRIEEELKSIEYLIDNGITKPGQKEGRERIREIYKLKDISILIFRIKSGSNNNGLILLGNNKGKYSEGFATFFSSVDFKDKYRIDRLNISKIELITGSLKHNEYFIVLYKQVPDVVKKRQDLFNSSLQNYLRLEYLKSYYKSSSGLFMLILAIIIIVISILVSLFLSKNITKPVLELADAAKKLATGNFNVKLKRESEDELGLLFSSFNQMIIELDRNKKVMYQKQKLDAWREMARRLVHEIKNPLTPIRLSAERIRRRFIENHSDIDRIIMSGTETIIEEVDDLMSILSEFTKFARLPEMKPEKVNIELLLKNCVTFFSGNENILFNVETVNALPQVNIDKILIRQAIINIIQNAIDAVNENGNISIISELVRENEIEYIRIKIVDDGIGISEDDLNKIFEPGFSKKRLGTGLGLAIVEKIVIEHRGKIYCKSEFGIGTEFIIDLLINTNGDDDYGENNDS